MKTKENKKEVVKEEIVPKKLKKAQYKLEKEKSNKGTTILIIAISLTILIIIAISVILTNYLVKNNSNSNNDNHFKDTISNYDIKLQCVMVNENDEKIESGNYINDASTVYGIGDSLICGLENNNKDNYREAIFTLSEQYFKLEKAYSNDSNVTVDISSKEDNSTIITFNSKNNTIKLSDVKLKLTVTDIPKDNEDYNITLSNIKLITSSSRYDYLQELSLKLKHPTLQRFVNDNNKLKFQTLTSDGTYKTTSEYTCKTSDNLCTVNNATLAFYYQNKDNQNIVLITDMDMSVFYDVNNGVIATYGGISRWLYSKKTTPGYVPEETYIYISDKDNNSYGIVDKNGNIIHDFNLNMKCTGNALSSDCLNYSIEDNLFVNKSEDKYGIVRIYSNDVVIDYKYEDIELLDSKYFKAKENNKWYVYDINTKSKHIENGYNDIYIIYNDILIASDGENWSFIDYNNKQVINDKIKYNLKNSYVYTYSDTKDSNIINIYLCNDKHCYETNEEYKYNISSKKLEKVK